MALAPGNAYRKNARMSTKPLKAVALRPTSELKRHLEVLERRIDFDRAKTLSLLSVRAAIQTELARCSAALYGLAFIGREACQ
jgi:hypothetical protein